MPVYGSTLSALREGLGESYAPASGEDWPARVVRAVSRLIPTDSCSYNHFAGATPLAWYIEPVEGGGFPDSASLFRQHVAEHPILAHHERTGDGTARRISDFLSDRQFR